MERRSTAVHGLADQAINQSGRQSFLSRPVVVCACGFGFSAGAPLSGSAGLEFLDLHQVRIFEPRDCYVYGHTKWDRLKEFWP